MNSNKILILDANQRSALAATRSLGKLENVFVFTADCSSCSLAGSSRYSKKNYCLPDPAGEPSRFLKELTALIKQENIGFLLPVTEVSCRTILENSQLFKNIILPFSDYDTVLGVSDKQQLMHRAELLNIPFPATCYYNKLKEWNYRDTKHFPLVIKPTLSRILIKGRWISTTVRIVRNIEQLESFLHQDEYLHYSPFMVQEFISGHGEGVFALYDKGVPICHFSHQRIREKPPQGGVSVLSRAKKVDSKIQQYADLLLREYRWSGVAMIEFRVADDGTAYLMEINTRFWGSLQLSIDSGIDFPALLYKLFTEQALPNTINYQKNQQLRWFLGDLDSLYLYMRDKNYSKTEKTQRLLNFIKIHHNTRNEIFRLDDWRPALFELQQYCKDLLA